MERKWVISSSVLLLQNIELLIIVQISIILRGVWQVSSALSLFYCSVRTLIARRSSTSTPFYRIQSSFYKRNRMVSAALYTYARLFLPSIIFFHLHFCISFLPVCSPTPLPAALRLSHSRPYRRPMPSQGSHRQSRNGHDAHQF
jgi:hypothetical protein